MLQRVDFGNITTVHALTAAVYNTDQDSTSADMREFDGALIVVNVGNSADTLSGSNFIELEIETSPNDSDWTDADDADLSSSVTGTNTGTFALINAPSEDTTTFTVAYIGRNAFVRLVVNFTGTHSTGTPISANIIQGRDKYS